MNEALDLSVNSAPLITASVPSGHATQLPLSSGASSIHSPPAVNTLNFLPFEADFLQGFSQNFPSFPTVYPPSNAPSQNSQLLQTPPTIQVGNDALLKFAPLMVPTSLTQVANGVTSKETPSNAIDLSLQTILQTPHHPPVHENFMNLASNLSQSQTLINQNASPRSNTNSYQSSDYLPLLEQASRVSAAQGGKELLRKFTSFQECGHAQCRAAGLKEHFHCNDCHKVINRREETIRHAKWHRKRAESLQYGFMRYSSCDNCGYPNCSHNLKQTHYHCIRTNCNKTYISTSDVQMHANFHRKDAVIMQEGFRRFRAAEDCGSQDCPFSKERTTHFHCQRGGCKFTFKNKADMEKHKNHHLKNDTIAKDGFRKFTKSETCSFVNCKYSGQVNHIHCIRQGCDYVVHSTSQISSHKRKHERRDSLNYPCTMAPQTQLVLPQLNCESNNGDTTVAPNTTTATTSATTTPKPSPPQSISPSSDPQSLSSTTKLLQRVSKISDICWQMSQEEDSNLTLSNDSVDIELAKQVFEDVNHSLKAFKDKSSCDDAQCSFHSTGIDHFHCFRTGCMDTLEMDPEDKFTTLGDFETISSGDMDSWRDHWNLHAWQSIASITGFSRCCGEICNSNSESKAHLHCFLWPSCNFSIDINLVDPPRLLRHLTKHNPHFGTMMYQMKEQTSCLSSELGGSISQRKRGRPPKHSRDIHIPRLKIHPERCQDDNPSIPLGIEDFLSKPDMIVGGLKFFPVGGGVACVDRCCPYFINKQDHFHCIRPRCYLATSDLAYANSHRREFHPYTPIELGYEHFDRSIDCRRPACYAKRDSAHYHCLRPRCGYSFVRVSKMKQHTELHEGGLNGSVSGANALEKCEEVLGSITQSAGSILPPLGLEKNATSFNDIMPFLMRILLTDQTSPLSNAINLLNPENMEPGEEKMDWNEIHEKMEATSVFQSPNMLPISMEKSEHGSRKAESNEDNA
ncbi:unnamed protein product [Rodentolepis nana]|uniref:C2H2-type domain-containing protein n=1 Tax=Rodentolepis nana TaxID=102285 RepID=A0A158QGT1_RODNA|nr:unnamed protein product [Rodentolepis nana]